MKITKGNKKLLEICSRSIVPVKTLILSVDSSSGDIATDDFNQPLSLSFVDMDIIASAGGTAAVGQNNIVELKVNDISSGYRSILAGNDNTGTFTAGVVRNLWGRINIRLKCINNMLSAFSRYGYSDGTTRAQSTNVGGLASLPGGKITKISWASTYTLPAGTVIEIRGAKI